MTKRHVPVDDGQLSLLDLIKESEELRRSTPSEGSMNIHSRFCHVLTQAIKDSGYSRFEIAGRMSHLLGIEITKFMIDSWTSESKEGHRIPAEYLPAFCSATESRESIQILSELGGMFCLPGPEALRAEIHKLSEEEKQIRIEKRKREQFLKEMEGRR
ncbi:hypothetical protein HTZ97_09400 [Desulfuromonas acetoxidans]|uniref:hypothetical protein n=1 Tax=Desulfuromonas acetoxidans TaxID=891 RepID=UPI0006826A3D|nr:hypothetical protein [Desulfuromonas acetoxidans]MBF0646413.1 hypothetical protein [Desulfuromonas acetoxidans]NVD24372.1 hypothetical protein [Desulfuromonas acetoxidans]NVE16680.1 hypothetical protein [Desulfuromonas acetoxidans]